MVYVDSIRECKPNDNWKHRCSCHMFADTEEELVRFAVKIKLRPKWLQRKPVLHFDLTANKRNKALQAGAVAVGLDRVKDIITAQRVKR